jgi:hypothetical protein
MREAPERGFFFAQPKDHDIVLLGGRGLNPLACVGACRTMRAHIVKGCLIPELIKTRFTLFVDMPTYPLYSGLFIYRIYPTQRRPPCCTCKSI